MKFIYLVLISILFGLIILKLNIMTPMWGDDFEYSFIYGTDIKIKTFSDIIYSQYKHYMGWGGRTVVHVIAQSLLTLFPLKIDIINTLAYIFYTFAIYFHIKGHNSSHNIFVYILINLFVWFFVPEYGETILWVTGSANYLWGTLIILSFLLPYRMYGINTKSSSIFFTLLKCIGMLFLGILAGWTNENVAIAMIVMIILWLFYWKKQELRFPVWAVCGLVGSILGYILLISAPGNYERIETFGAPPLKLFTIYFKFNMHTARLVNNMGVIILLTMIFSILVLKFTHFSRRNFIYTILIYVIGVFISTYAMILSPSFPDRAWLGIITFSIIPFGISYMNINMNINFLRYIKTGTCILFSIAFIFSFYKSYKEIKLVNNMWLSRYEQIKVAIGEKEEDVKINSIHKISKYTMGDYPVWGVSMSKYYGINIEME